MSVDRGFPWCNRCSHPRDLHDLAGRCSGTTMTEGRNNFSTTPKGRDCDCGAPPDTRSGWSRRDGWDDDDEDEQEDDIVVTKNTSAKGKAAPKAPRKAASSPSGSGIRMDLKAQQNAARTQAKTPSPTPKRAAGGATRAAQETVTIVARPASTGRPSSSVVGGGVAKPPPKPGAKPAPAKRTTKNSKGR
jgi:hypothetical protein